MQSVDAEGNLLESRHSCQGGGASGAEAISSIDDLTQDIWQAANRGGGYSAEDVVVGACEEYSGHREAPTGTPTAAPRGTRPLPHP